MSRNKFKAAGSKKAKVRGEFVEHVRRDKLLARYDGCCGICGLAVNPQTFEVDHIIPRSKGGTHCYANCQPAHAWCNRLKGNLMPEEVSVSPRIINGKRIKDRYLNNVGYQRQQAA